MSAIVRLSPRAFIVRWKNVERWSVNSFSESDWHWPADIIRPLSAALSRKLDVVEDNGRQSQGFALVTLHFNGEMEPRNQGSIDSFKGRLFRAERGDVIYSKIDVRNGAIGIVPDDLGRVCVSSEYPVYEVDPTIADPRYVKLLFRTRDFRRRINSMISGASGRKRVQPSDMEAVAVPFPPLAVQRQIVATWQAARQHAEESAARIEQLERDLEARFLKDLGLEAPRQVELPKAFAIPWRELERWSVMYNQYASVAIDPSGGAFPVANLGELAAVSYGIQKCPANRPGKNPRPYLRVANVQRGELDLREIKQIDVADEEFAGFRLEPGDLLVCEGNSADLVGRPAMWRGEIPDCVHQNHILKVRVDRSHAIPEFVLEYMSSAPARNHFRARAKFTTNLASINSNDLRDLAVPLPPLNVQQGIVRRVDAVRAEIATLKADAKARTDRAKADVEAMILGTKPID